LGSRNEFGPSRGRLHTPTIDYHNGTVLGGGWSAALNDKSQFIQVKTYTYQNEKLIYTGKDHLLE
jgi:hypothetical protein